MKKISVFAVNAIPVEMFIRAAKGVVFVTEDVLGNVLHRKDIFRFAIHKRMHKINSVYFLHANLIR